MNSNLLRLLGFSVALAACARAESFLDQNFLVDTYGVSTVAALESGKILIGGSLTSVNGFARPSHLARLNSDGSVDTTFSPQVTVAGNVSQLERQSDGKIMEITDAGFIQRLMSDGTPDPSFNSSAPGVKAVFTMPDGKIMIGGNFTVIDGKPRQYFARLNNDGSLDDTYSTDVVPATVTAILGQADGRVLIGGSFYDIGGTARRGLARLDASGNLDISFNFGGQGLPTGSTPRMVRQQTDGGFLIMTGNGTFRVTSSGAADSAFSTLAGNFQKIAEWNDGILLAGNYINTKDLALARLTRDGHVDTNFVISFGPAYSSTVTDFSFQPDGKILIVGSFATVDGELRNGIARLNTAAAPPSATINIRVAPAITISGSVGSEYRLEYATKVGDAVWSPLTDFVLTNSEYLFIDQQVIGENRFYRAVAVQ